MALFNGKNDLRCPVCLFEYQSAAMRAASIKGCPSCHTSLTPQLLREDGWVRVNWQDLRALAIYAQRWSITFDLSNSGNRDSLRALQNIFGKLRQYEPKGSQPLTPAMDAVVVRSTKDANGELTIEIESSITELKADHTGLVPSPFYQRKPPPLT